MMLWTVVLALLCASSISGCAVTIPIGNEAPKLGAILTNPTVDEVTYQSLAAVDFAQTLQIAKDPQCYREDGTIAARVIGKHPSEGTVTGYFVAQSLLHLAVTRLLSYEVDRSDGRGWLITRNLWEAVTVAHTAENISANSSEGLGVWSSHCPDSSAGFRDTSSAGRQLRPQSGDLVINRPQPGLRPILH